MKNEFQPDPKPALPPPQPPKGPIITAAAGDPDEPDKNMNRKHRQPKTVVIHLPATPAGVPAIIGSGQPLAPAAMRLSLFPGSDRDWALGLARPLLVACVATLLFSIICSFDRIWRYIGYPVAGGFLPLLGAALALACLLSKNLNRKFLAAALIVAAFSILGGVALVPALTE